MDVNNAGRTLTVVLEPHLVQVVLMARFLPLDLLLKLTVMEVKNIVLIITMVFKVSELFVVFIK